MMDTTQFWDKIAPKYALQPIKNQAAYDATLNATRAHLKDSDHVLEIGCGTGMTSRLLAPCVASILGTDISPNMIAIAQEKAQVEGISNVDFTVATPGQAAQQGGGYDCLLAYNFLHLAEDLPATLAHVYSLLKPGGTFISKSACMGGPYRVMWPLVKGLQILGKAPTVTFFTRAQLDGMMNAAGFEKVEDAQFTRTALSYFVVARKS